MRQAAELASVKDRFKALIDKTVANGCPRPWRPRHPGKFTDFWTGSGHTAPPFA